MSNPWIKKNPFLSLWLSGANKAAGAARGKMAAEGQKQRSKMGSEIVRFWSAALLPATKPKSKRKR